MHAIVNDCICNVAECKFQLYGYVSDDNTESKITIEILDGIFSEIVADDLHAATYVLNDVSRTGAAGEGDR